MHGSKECTRYRCIAPAILNLGTRWRCVQLHAPFFLPPGKKLQCPLNMRLGVSQNPSGSFGIDTTFCPLIIFSEICKLWSSSIWSFKIFILHLKHKYSFIILFNMYLDLSVAVRDHMKQNNQINCLRTN